MVMSTVKRCPLPVHLLFITSSIHQRCILLFLLLLSSSVFFILLLNLQAIPSSRPTFPLGHPPRPGFVVDTAGCRIPDLDPFDKSIRHIFLKTYNIRCNATPPMTYTDSEWLRINRTALKLYYPDALDYCELQEILRPDPTAPDPDNIYSYNRTVVTFMDDNKMNSSFIRLACYGKKGDMIYSAFHAFILTNEKLETEADIKFKRFVNEHNPKETMNIQALGIDALSRLNFIRQMPKTRRYLLKKLHAIELKGMNKVADNTFVNLVPMFTGKFVEELPWDEMMSHVPFDNFTFLWNTLSERGYRTFFAEDAPRISTFNFGKAGFHKRPTDYYLRPFNLALEEHTSIWNNNGICVGSKQETQVVLDYLGEFISRFKDKPYFALTFITRLTHDTLNKAGLGDDLYYEFLKWMHENGHLNNTALIFFSDHGIRFGPIRETYIGKLEERLPMAYVIMPAWFREKYPVLWNNLQVNQNRLTTPFDFFETLKDISHFTGEEKLASVANRGISLFSDIPVERTCEHAEILPHWCTCHEKQPISLQDTIVMKATKAVIGYINRKLHHGTISPCAVLKLKKITDALKLLSNDHVLSFKQSLHDVIGREVFYGEKAKALVDYLITFQVHPGDGLFESTVRHSIADDEFEVIGDISRINAYGNTAHCMPSYSLQKYCYCL